MDGQRRRVDVYSRRNNNARFERVEGVEEKAWQQAVKLKVMSRNFDDEGLCAMIFYPRLERGFSPVAHDDPRRGESRPHSGTVYLIMMG